MAKVCLCMTASTIADDIDLIDRYRSNIDCAELLCRRTEAEVKQAVRDCISNGARGGGLIVSSSNSIHSGVKPANYATMIRAVHEFGGYPSS